MLIKYGNLPLLLFLVGTTFNAAFAKYRICIVDGEGGYQKSDKYCPKLVTAKSSSEVECVKGLDSFDCLRKLRKNMADFSIFSSEDLVAASNTENAILITNELRNSLSELYQEQIVAVVSDSSGITSTYDLQDKILCHPGYKSNGFVSDVLANFLESIIVRPQSCDVQRTVPENRIRSSSRFFKSACKPGPWVNDPGTDRELKQKYENLCKACSSPLACTRDDKYYGSSGSLLCLKDGTGDISWTTYRQVRLQFDLDNKNRSDEWTNFKFLCRDNTLKPLNTTKPCIWAAQPWPVVAANKVYAAEIQNIVANASHTGDWKGSLLDLLEIIGYHVEIYTLDGTPDVDSYLSHIPGYLNANSFTGCHPPRTVRICTTSIPSQYKCGWMREAAAVHGLEPDIDCLKADNATHCMDAIQRNVADVVIVHPDYVNIAKKQYNLKTLFYETVNNDGKYLTVPVVNRLSKIKTFADIKGKRACFPLYDGVSWNTVVHELDQRKLISTCPYEEALANFFGDSCVPGIPQNYSAKLGKLCNANSIKGDEGALDCIKNGVGDVAFVSGNSLRTYVMDKENAKFDFRIICEHEPCHLSWSPAGQAMISRNTTVWRDKDILDVFLEIDNLFGNGFKQFTRMFTMYGEFDGKHNILFNDNTVGLQKIPNLKNEENMPRQYEELLAKIKPCRQESSSSIQFVPSKLALYISLFYSILRINMF